MKKFSWFLLFAMFTLLSCEKEKGDTLGEGVLIRLENTSSYTYTDIKVQVAEEREYEDLNPGKKSAYMSFTKAYRYAYVELKINGKRYVIQPIDFVGEEELKDGKYTYQISADATTNEYGRLGLTFKED